MSRADAGSRPKLLHGGGVGVEAEYAADHWNAARLAREGLASKPRRSFEQVELESLRRKAERLEAALARAMTALEITGKVNALLEQLSESAVPETKSKPSSPGISVTSKR